MRWLIVPLLLLPACEKDPPERPTPPDLSALVAEYANPTGELNDESAIALVEAIPERLNDVADVLSLIVVASGGVTGFAGIDTEEAGLSVAQYGLSTETGTWTLSAEGGGWGELRRRCPGWDDGGDRGVLTLRVLINEDGLGDTVWGEVAGCRAVNDDGLHFKYDGELAIFAPNLGQDGFLFSLKGVVENDHNTHDFELDLQLFEDLLMMRHTLLSGHFLIGLDTQQVDGLRIADADGLWSCDQSSCTGPGGQISW